MKLIRVEWSDLLRVPFLDNGDDPAVGLDCFGLAREIARRAGIPFPDVGIRPSEEAVLRASCFTKLMRWDEVGDILAADPTKRGFVSHVSVVVDTEKGLALSTAKRSGPYCWPIHRVHNELGAWRVNLTTVAAGRSGGDPCSA